MANPALERYSRLHHADLSTWSLVHGKDSVWSELPASVRFLTRRRDEQVGAFLTEPLDAETAKALHGRVYALAGHTALATSVVRGILPRGLEMLVLRALSVADLDAIAAAEALDRITALAVLDGPPRTEALGRLLARPLPALDSLSIFDATDALVGALPESLLARLETIRIEGPVRARERVLIDLTRVLGGDRRATTTLDLTQLHVDARSLAAWARGDWSALEHLRVHSCDVHEGGAVLADACFPALRELRSTTYHPPAPRCLGDAVVAAIVRESPRLEIVSLEGSDAGDQTALALAEHGRHLQYVNLDKTRVGDAGAIALGASVVFDDLEFFELDTQLSFDAAHAMADSRFAPVRENANRPYRGLATIRSWAPKPPPPETTPAPEPAIPRAFRWQHYEECEACGGHIPWDGCPWHTKLVIHPMARGSEPPTPAARAWVAAHGALMTRVEELGRQMLETMIAWGKHGGEPRVTWWLLDHAHRGYDRPPFDGPLGLDAILDAVGRPPHATTASWAHACVRARTRDFPDVPDPYTPAREIANLGISIIGLDADDGLLLALRTA